MEWKRRECLTFSVTLCLSPLSLFSSFSHSFPIVMLRVPYLYHLGLILVHWPQVVWADSELVLRKPEFVCCIGQTHLSKRNKTHSNKCKKHVYPLPSNYDSALIYTFLEYKYWYAALLILSILSNRSIQKCFISTRNKNQEDQFKICRLCSNCIKGSNSL